MDEVTRFSAFDMALNGSPDEKRAWLKARRVRVKAGQAPARGLPVDGQLDGL